MSRICSVETGGISCSETNVLLSRTIAGIGLRSLLILLTAPASQGLTVLWFAGLTLSIAASLRFGRGADHSIDSRNGAEQYAANDSVPSRRS